MPNNFGTILAMQLLDGSAVEGQKAARDSLAPLGDQRWVAPIARRFFWARCFRLAGRATRMNSQIPTVGVFNPIGLRTKNWRVKFLTVASP